MLILGAGLAGMVAAIELRKAGYKVQVLEYHGARRRPLLDAARRRQLHRARRREPELRVRSRALHQSRALADSRITTTPCSTTASGSASRSSRSSRSTTTPIVHAQAAFGGKPQRFRARLVPTSRAASPSCSPRRRAGQARRAGVRRRTRRSCWRRCASGARSTPTIATSKRVRDQRPARLRRAIPGGGLTARAGAVRADRRCSDVVQSRLWARMPTGNVYEFQTDDVPAGRRHGHDREGVRSARSGDLIRFNAKVDGDQAGRRAASPSTYVDARQRRRAADGRGRLVRLHHPALGAVSQIDMNVGAPMAAAIERRALRGRRSRSACSSSAASGRRTSTSMAASPTPTCRSRMISYPSTGFFRCAARACCSAPMRSAPTPTSSPRCRRPSACASALEFGAQIHPQYRDEFDNGVSVGWHRVPGDARLLRRLDRAKRAAALRQSLRDRRAHHAGRRARLLHARLAGGRRAFRARRDRPAAPARGGRVMRPRHHGVLGAALLVAAGAALPVRPGPVASGDQPRSAQQRQGGAASDSHGFISATRFGQQDGGALYGAICAGCHMPDGRGAVGAGAYPALAGNPKLEYSAYPVSIVLGGLHGMPGFATQLDDNQVAAVVNWVRTNLGNNYTADPATPQDVKIARSTMLFSNRPNPSTGALDS